MKIGTTLHLKVKDPNNNQMINCRCKIIGNNEEKLYIDYPINDQTKQTCFLSEGTILTATYLTANKNLFQFKTKIEKRVKKTVPALLISRPNQEDLKQIQRRQFVRVHTAIDVAVHFIDGLSKPFTTVTDDISAGGMSIVIPDEVTVDQTIVKGRKLSFTIVLYMSLDIHYIQIEGEIVRFKTLTSGLQTASIKFLDINNQIRQKIIRFCFAKQREARKKELI